MGRNGGLSNLALLWRKTRLWQGSIDSIVPAAYAGYLLHRTVRGYGQRSIRPAPVKLEVLNDLNRRVINWLRVGRDQPDDFGRLVEKTPISRVEYQWALTAMDDESLPPLRRALAFHIVVDQSIPRSDTTSKSSWRCVYKPDSGRRNHNQPKS